MAPGDYSPGAPTDPCVRTLPHTAPQNIVVICYRFVDIFSEVKASCMLPGNKPMFRRFASLHRFPRWVHRLQRYYQIALTSNDPSCRTSFSFVWQYQVRVRSVLSPPPRTRKATGVLTDSRRYLLGNRRISQVPVKPQVSIRPVPATPVGSTFQTTTKSQCCSRFAPQRKLQR